ncbi:homeodomain-like protein [Tanacetum coccineum]
MLRSFPMSLTGATSHWLRNKPSGSIKTWEDLKAKFLSKYCPPAGTAKKMEEINKFQQEPDETLYQAWERFKELLMKCPRYYLTKMQEVILFYNGLEVSTRQILDSKGAIPTKTVTDAKARSTETSDGLAAIQAQINNLRREIKKVNEKVYAAQVGCELCKGPYYTKDCPLKEEDRIVKHPKGIAKNVLVGIGKFVFPVDFIILYMPEDVKMPLILKRPFLSTVHAKIDVFKRKINLRVGDEKIIFKSVKPASSLIKRVYMLSLRERMELDLEARLMGETLILNRSLDLLYGDYIELNDLNVPLELRRNQVDDLKPTIEEGKVVDKPMIEEVKTRNDDKMVSKISGYPIYCDFDDKIHINCAYNLKFTCMIGFELVLVNFLLILPINVMSKKFYNSIMKDKIEFRGRNELGNFVNAPVFIGNFYVITDFTVVEDMDPYLDEGMGDVVVGEPFCKASCVETRRFDRIITIRDEDDSVNYQMVRSNPSFKHLTNIQRNKIPPLLKVSEQDKMNGISYSYQKLKGFYKGVLNLEPDFIRDAKVEEWLTRGHISVHEME